MKSSPQKNDASNTLLGMDQKITREDYVSPVSTAAAENNGDDRRIYGLTAEDWDGYGGVGDYSSANGNTHNTMVAGHTIRDEVYNASLDSAATAEETYDCVVVGGGISGMAAAQAFIQHTEQKSCLVLENHSIFGGEARRNEFDVNGQRLIAPQGSAMFFPPLQGSSLLAFYQSMGFDGQGLEYQTWGGSSEEIPLENTTYAGDGKSFGMFFGQRFGHPEGLWVVDPWGKHLEGAPFPAEIKRELLASNTPRESQDLQPKIYGDAASRALDRMTQEDRMIRQDGLSRETIRTYMPYAASGAGASADAISALADFIPDLQYPWDQKQGSQMFPGGNAGIARYQMKALVPDAIPGPLTLRGVCRARIDFAALDRPHQPVRIRLRSTVLAVKHDGDPAMAKTVTVTYLHEGKLRRVQARSVVMAGGWSTWRVVQDLPESHREAYRQFFRMPCLVANIALTNWRFLAKAGMSECSWYEGLGYSFAVRKMPIFSPAGPTISPDSPTVLTLKILFTEPGLPLQQQATRGRMKMLSTPFSEYERSLREQFSLMFARWGFDARNDIAGIILNRWGHAYLCAQPGFFFGENDEPAPREILRRAPFNRIAFANSDLSGIMDHRASIGEAQRAVTQLLA
ncbi:MAG TPA: NAD(P)-binding protein [Acidobacteriaceae bacterium]|jgi:spermidine dehydrogenase|nr:NAD(P)-binding protein [Acidobacteriaceae bacterium]